jgi:ketol-acid reductoisomerase
MVCWVLEMGERKTVDQSANRGDGSGPRIRGNRRVNSWPPVRARGYHQTNPNGKSSSMAAKIYRDKDADLKVLKGKTCAVIGFGSQGHAHALNLKESGVKVIIGLYKKSKSIPVAKAKGFDVLETGEAVKKADVIFLAVPDTKIPEVYEKDVAPNLKPGKTLLFSHGLAVHFKLISVPAEVNVIMVAPKGPGHIVRRQFTEGKGVPSLIAIHQDATGTAKKIALAWAKGIGGTRGGVFETSFKEETETDLFGEQCVLCGGASALVKAGFEVLVEAGYQPEMAYFECLHELKLIVDLMNESGIAGMRFSISETAEYGDVTVGPKIIDASVKKRMAQQLKRIQKGEFTKEWMAEYQAGCPNFNRIRKEEAAHPIEETGARLRALMPWIKKRKVKTGAAQASYE